MKASTEEAEESVEEAEEPTEIENQLSEASGIHKIGKNKQRGMCVNNQSERNPKFRKR